MTAQHSTDLPPFAKPIPGFDGYCADPDGGIWSRYGKGYSVKDRKDSGRWRVLHGWTMRGGYKMVTLATPDRMVKKMVHVLVLETFVGPRPEGMDACHENGKRGDNRLANLRWDTRKANMQDAVRHGTTNRGERNPFVKLSASQVIEIRRVIETGIPQTAIARQFGVSQQTISNIKVRTWRHIL